VIQLADIQPGDQVGLMDRNGNIARGVVARRGVMLSITAFGASLEFARTNAGSRVVASGPVRVIEHTPTLVGGAA
jgi:hypothetical protein